MRNKILSTKVIEKVLFSISYHYITVTSPVKPAASFEADKKSGIYPLKVIFTDKGAGASTPWLWSFGDGKTSSEKNPTHTTLKQENIPLL